MHQNTIKSNQFYAIASVLGGILGKFSTSGNLANVDLNDIRVNSNYSQLWFKTSDSAINAPQVGNGVLLSCSFGTGANGVTFQIFLGDSGIATRGYNMSVIGWSAWKNL